MRKVVAIVGATATGKSELSQLLAEYINGEVLSCDSMQIYSELTIGTAKLLKAEQRVPHHGLNISSYAQPYSAAQFKEYAHTIIEDCFSRGKTPVACGGSGLYVRAALDRMNFASGEQEENPLREKYELFFEQHGKEELHALLAQRDPKAAEIVHQNNVKRVIRALEMSEGEVLYSKQVQGFKTYESVFPTCYIGLSCSRERLYERINTRVDRMLERGLIDEVTELYHSGLKEALTAAQAIGYKELFDYLEGALSLDEAVELIKRNTRRFAKRQMTWFKSDERISWIDTDILSSDEIFESALKIWTNYDSNA